MGSRSLNEYGLNDRQERFALEYNIDFNGTHAAIRAGYSPKTAGQIASELLKHPKVSARVEQIKAADSRRLGISPERILGELAKVGFANIEDVADFETAGTKKTAKRQDLAAVSSIRVKRTSGPYGDSVERELKMHDKLKALSDLGKHLGLFDANNKLTLAGAVQIVDDIPDGDEPDA